MAKGNPFADEQDRAPLGAHLILCKSASATKDNERPTLTAICRSVSTTELAEGMTYYFAVPRLNPTKIYTVRIAIVGQKEHLYSKTRNPDEHGWIQGETVESLFGVAPGRLLFVLRVAEGVQSSTVASWLVTVIGEPVFPNAAQLAAMKSRSET